MLPKDCDSKNLVVSPQRDFYILYFSRDFLLIETFMKLINSSKSKVLVYIWFMGLVILFRSFADFYVESHKTSC